MTTTGAASAIEVSRMGQHRHLQQASHLVLQQISMVALGDLRGSTHSVWTAVALSLPVSKGSFAHSAGRLFTNGALRPTRRNADLILAALVTVVLQMRQVKNPVVKLVFMSPFPAKFAARSLRRHARNAATGPAISI